MTDLSHSTADVGFRGTTLLSPELWAPLTMLPASTCNGLRPLAPKIVLNDHSSSNICGVSASTKTLSAAEV